jgi:aspartate 1-decarboxylase
MFLSMLKAKIHRATVTDANLEYQGSVTVDRDLLEAAGILPHEAVDIYDVTNGARLTTYTLEAPAGSGTLCINGAAAHHVRKGDVVILCAYAHMELEEARAHQPKVVLVDGSNRIVSVSRYVSGRLKEPGSIP